MASDAAGNFVVAWQGQAPGGGDIFAQRYDASGVRQGAELLVNTTTTNEQHRPVVAADVVGNFIVAWESVGSPALNVFAQRFSASGTPRGAEFQVNANSVTDHLPSVASDGIGNFVVVWQSVDQNATETSVLARFYDAAGAPRGAQFQVNTYTAGNQGRPSVALNEVGNVVVAWPSNLQDGDSMGIFGQRYGGLDPAALTVDSSGNRVLEPGESVDVRPSWRNLSGAAQTFSGTLTSITGPAGAAYAILDGAGDYGTVADGATMQCADCYSVSVSNPPTRPTQHWDASAVESIVPSTQGPQKLWLLHMGGSFPDVPLTNGFYQFTHLGLSPPGQEEPAPTPELVRVPVDDEGREILAG